MPENQIPKYVAPPDAKIIGLAIGAVVNSILFDEIKPFFEKSMHAYGYSSIEINENEWYPLQMLLDTYKEISQSGGGSPLLVSVGTKVIENAILPPEIDSIAKCVTLLRDISDLNLQNVPSEMNYQDIQVEPKRLSFIDNTVFPHDLIYGYVFGIARRFKVPGTHPTVERTYLNKENPDAAGARYLITW
ncbi:MAG: hypothetical protein BroJett018_29190 [Chloroflexota bacterium]|nr:MAG: hypothetical protein BroJett018_29190 [Chloroflexota bacterium]